MSTPEHPKLTLDRLDAAVFDLDGVITDTATLHEQAWAETFQAAFASAASLGTTTGRDFSHEDYRRLVDGRPRLEGVRNVLVDRDLHLEDGLPTDRPASGSAWAIANAEDARFLELLGSIGPRPFPSSVALLRHLRRAGVPTALVTASRHADEVLATAGLGHLFDAVVDGEAAAAMHLAGKPAPDTFGEALVRLGARPERSAVFEDEASGVAAGRSAGFGLVVGVDRHGDAKDLLASGAQLVARDLAEVEVAGHGPANDGWHLEEPESGPEREGIRETLYTLGNGYLATRGARSYVVADAATHYPGTYFAGVYDRSAGSVGGEVVEQEAIVNAPNWLALRFSIDGGPLVGENGTKIISKSLRLDLRRGLLERRFDVVVDEKVTSVLERRLVSMAAPHLAAIEMTLVAENWTGTLELRSGLDGAVADTETIEERLLAGRHLEILDCGEEPPDLIWLAARTVQSKIALAQAARTTVSGDEKARVFVSDGARPAHAVTVRLEEHGRLTCEKVVASYTSRDFAISEPIGAARAAARRAGGFALLLEAHERAWEELWRRGAIELGDQHVATQRAVNLHRFHLLQVASPHVVDRDVGLGARGLHGEGYLGHVFWDELFILPVLTLRFPETVRALLSYRSRRLEEARHAARAAGHVGAMFPWQSGSDGRDETPEVLYNPRSGRWVPDRSRYQRHVGLAIAFNFWQYWQATGDIEHLVRHGAEVIVEIARFFASLAVFDDRLGRNRIKGVMGPDEFHDGYPGTDEPGIDDNAYTNVMAAWLFGRAVELAGVLERSGRAGVLERLVCTSEELGRFEGLSHTLHVPFFDGVISQFEGYEALEPIDLEAYRARYGNIGRLDLILEAEGDTVRRYQVAKQPDVLMLLYLFSAEELRDVLGRLGYELSAQTIRRTVAFYSSRATHGSSLSRVVHAWVTSRSDRRASWQYFSEALALDLHDSQGGTTREGVHLGAMAGTIDILARCYIGLEVRADALWLNPRLPRQLDRIAFALQYRGHLLYLEIDHREVRVEARGGPPTSIAVLVRGRPYTLEPGEQLLHELA
jgi:HAD superfamily hydrolase (TIGR01509 family)